MPKLSRQKGFSLIELVVTIVILAIALVSVTFMISGGISKSSNIILETQAVALAHAYLDEISGRRYDEKSSRNGLRPCFALVGARRCTATSSFGPDGAETTRRRYDDVDDYHGLQEGQGFASPIEDAEGNVRSGYDNFRVEISVRYGGSDAILGLADPTHAKLILVKINHNSDLIRDWSFSAYKGNY